MLLVETREKITAMSIFSKTWPSRHELRKKTARQVPRNPPANLWGRNYPRAQKKTPQRTDFSHVFYCLTRNIESNDLERRTGTRRTVM